MERPEVTVRGSTGPVATGGGPWHRPWAVTATSTAAVLILVAGVVTTRVQAPRDDVIALSLTDRFAFADAAGAQISGRAAVVNLELELSNDGPLPVLLDRAVVGDFRFTGRVALDPDETALLPLVRTVTCPVGEPPLDPVAEGLRVRVRTPSGVTSVLISAGVLPLDRLRTAARRACGFLPIEDAVRLTARAVSAAVVRLTLTNTSARPLRLRQVLLARGLRAEPLVEPIPLPARLFGRDPIPVTVDVPVTAACVQAPLRRDGSLLSLPVDPVQVVIDDGGDVAVGPLTASTSDVTLLRQAFTDACSASRAS